MFSSQFAEYSLAKDDPEGQGGGPMPMPGMPDKLRQMRTPMRGGEKGGGGGDKSKGTEPFATEGVIASLDAVDTSERSVALRMESLIAGNTTGDHNATALSAALEDWMRITHHVMDYQYVHDMNSYVKAVQNDERTRLNQQYSSISNDVMIKKHMYIMRERDARKLQSRVRVILHSMLFVSGFSFLYANRAFFGAAGWILMGIGSFAFGIYLIMYLKISSTRRYNDWDALYFNDGEDIETESSTDDLLSAQTCEQTGSVPFGTVA